MKPQTIITATSFIQHTNRTKYSTKYFPQTFSFNKNSEISPFIRIQTQCHPISDDFFDEQIYLNTKMTEIVVFNSIIILSVQFSIFLFFVHDIIFMRFRRWKLIIIVRNLVISLTKKINQFAGINKTRKQL